MTFHTQSKNRSEIKRDIGRHILNGLIFNIKGTETYLKSDPSYHLLKRALKKGPMIAWETFLFNGCTHTHTHNTPATNSKRFAFTFWKRKNSSKGLNLTKSEEHPQKLLIVASFEEDDEKAQYAFFKHILINSCTKLIIDSVHSENINSPWEYSLTLTL